MRRPIILKLLSAAFCIVLIAAMALFTIGCNDNEKIGSGNVEFDFTVVDAEGNETKFKINTDKTTVGEALLEEGLIAGEEGQYGLYVKTVNGTTLDYDEDGMYWSFYINGEYAMTGVDKTDIVAGDSYAFKAEK